VKATNPLAQQGKSMYYVHSKTACYAYHNSFSVEFWDECFVKTFGLVCPLSEFFSVSDLENLLDAKIERYAF
jgi:hypothetical protein